MKYGLLNFFVLFLLLAGCEKNKTPLSVETPNYTSHDYEWEIDTLHAPDAFQVLMRGVWGTDENNVWVVGHSDETKYQVWHWDGLKWENHYLLFPGHPHSLKDIYGFSESDIWIVGTDYQNYPNTRFKNFIVYYNGNNWELIEGIDAPFCISVWGTSSSNLFVGADSGFILYFNGTDWIKQTTETSAQIISIQGINSQKIYTIGAGLDDLSPYDSTFYYFFEYNEGSWKTRGSFIKYPFSPKDLFGEKLWASPEGNLYSVGNDGLYLWQDNFWLRLREERLSAINGTQENNIFIAGPRNNIFHFNGDSWQRFEFFNKYYFDAGFSFCCNQDHVFMTAQEGNCSYMIRGHLLERR